MTLFETVEEFFEDTFVLNFIHYNVRLQYHLSEDYIPPKIKAFSKEDTKKIIYIQARIRAYQERQKVKMIKERYIKSLEREILYKKIKILDNKKYMIYGTFLKQRMLFLLETDTDTI